MNDHRRQEAERDALERAKKYNKIVIPVNGDLQREIDTLKAEVSSLRVTLTNGTRERIRVDIMHLFARILLGIIEIFIMLGIAVLVYKIYVTNK